MPWVLLAAAAARAAAAPAPGAVELVTVAANTGAAAGGHSALRVGSRVYHYQVGGDHLLRLQREEWDPFEFRYRVLDNRSLRVAGLDLEPWVRERIARHLDRLYTVQAAHFERLDALVLEERWHEARGGASTELRLRGAGLLAAGGAPDPHALRLRAALERRHGAGFLASRRAAVEAALAAGAGEVSRVAPDGAPLRPGVLPDGGVLVAERRRDRLLLREALAALDEGRALAPQALVESDPEAPALGPGERVVLAAFAAELEASTLRLIASPRPDRGFPLLLTLARFQVVHRSLATGRLHWLEARPDEAVVVPLDDVRRRGEVLAPLARAAAERARALRARLLAAPLSARGYLLLEDAATRRAELAAGARGERSIRLWGDEPLVPARVGTVAVAAAADRSDAARERARANRRHYERALREPYGYGLLDHNCATELVTAMRSAFPDAARADLALGGSVEPGRRLGFVPRALAGQVERTWALGDVRELPSYRKQRVRELAEQGSPLWVALRESNTWTSTAYRASAADDAFFWFTDVPVLLRPLQGAINLGYGILHTAVGVVAAPLDGGRRVGAGLRGVVYSLPELVGVNIRKGRYERSPEATRNP